MYGNRQCLFQRSDKVPWLSFETNIGQSQWLYDHRSLIVLRKAMLYDELTGGKKMKQAKSKIGTVKGGNKELASRSLSRQQKAARNNLRQTGKVQDAAALMGQLLAD